MTMKEVKMYCWTWCPYCIRAKIMLESKGVPYQEIVIDGDQEALEALTAQTGSRTVPQIFVNGEFIGGCDDLREIDAQGKLEHIFL
jgi:glutaredoxin 3